MKVLWVGVDGFEPSYLNRFSHPFWSKIRKEGSLAKIPCPSDIEQGIIGVASSPRLWAMMSTGVSPDINGVLGFWEKKTVDGEYLRANVGINWIREHKVEKVVNRDDLLVPPIWATLLGNGKSIGMVTPWFSYPLQDEEIQVMDEDSFFLTDFPFPREALNPERYRWPESADPPEPFNCQVGAGARIPILAQEAPETLRRRMIQQDRDRYDYALEQLKGRNPDFLGIYTRGVDGCQHLYKNQDNPNKPAWSNVEETEIVNDDDIKEVYRVNMDGIQELWETGKFDVLVISSDHGTDVLDGGTAHKWPAMAMLYGKFPKFDSLQAKYQDIPATILQLMGIEIPDHYEGKPLTTQADIAERLRKLGYF